MNDKPIGIFDSGVGGTSIWKEIHKLMPNEDTIYLADSKNAPYGEKTKAEILDLSIKNTELLLGKGCKLIVVACNTATTNAIAYLRKNYDLPFIGIEPAIKPAALQSSSKNIGVLATKGTLASDLFYVTSKNHASGISIIVKEGTGLVPLVESGKVDTKETEELLRKYLNPMLQKNIDHLVLGCTHYPYLIPVLKKILPDSVKIIDSGQAVAKQTLHILVQNNLRFQEDRVSNHSFYSNLDPAVLAGFLMEEKASCATSYLDF
ncbi:glutamate racemase [Spongiimicrobium sp. 3-5]|uniref:glutamate racemase n=1 Tax=Spongiimicrobium sp. 3-5 TaxID=3332596 RepID=UPI00397F1B20